MTSYCFVERYWLRLAIFSGLLKSELCSSCCEKKPIKVQAALAFNSWFRIVLAFLFSSVLFLSPVSAQTAQAAHNPIHSCALLEQMIEKGIAGGVYFISGNRLTWSDGDSFAVFVRGVCQTFYTLDRKTEKLRWDYVVRDALSHGAKVSYDTFGKPVGAGVAAAKAYFARYAPAVKVAAATSATRATQSSATSIGIGLIPRGVIQKWCQGAFGWYMSNTYACPPFKTEY